MAGRVEHDLGESIAQRGLNSEGMTKEKGLMAYYKEFCKQFTMMEGGAAKPMRRRWAR